MYNIRIERTTCPKEKPGADNPLKFGTIFTDHMFICDYIEGQGWVDPRVVPYQPLSLDPSCMVFHYGQEMFEGLKAYRSEDGRTLMFRPDKNIERAARSNKRLCMPEIPKELFMEGLQAVVGIDKDWVPTKPGTSLYVRPFMIATDPFLGVRPSSTYKFMIILSPVGAYYESGLDPVKIWIEDEYVRAVKGGIGEAKTGGNYVASLSAQVKAHDEGYAQVLWLDGVHRKYIEEVGAMNIFFKINGVVVTPEAQRKYSSRRHETVHYRSVQDVGHPGGGEAHFRGRDRRGCQERRDGGVLRYRNRCGGFPGGRASL